MNTKHFLLSKTILVNVMAIGVALFQYYVAPIPAVDPQKFAAAVFAINVLLRFVTTQGVHI